MTPHLVIATRNTHKVEEIKAVLGGRFIYHTLRDFPSAPDVAETGTTFEANARLKSEALARWLVQEPSTVAPTAGLRDPRLPVGGAQDPTHPRALATCASPGGPASPGSRSQDTSCQPSMLPGKDQPGLSAPWFVLADDSGLEVDALGGAPGVQSARFAAPEFNLEGNAPDGANNAKLLRLLAHLPEASRTARFRCVLALTSMAVPASQVSPAPTRCFSGACEGRIGFVPRGFHGFGYDPLFIPDGFIESLAELGDATKNRISHRFHALQAFLSGICEPTGSAHASPDGVK